MDHLSAFPASGHFRLSSCEVDYNFCDGYAHLEAVVIVEVPQKERLFYL